MARRFRGEELTFPLDLSTVVRHACVPWPLRVASADLATAATVTLKQVERAGDAPDVVTVRLEFDGVPSIVVVDRRDGPQAPLRFRFAEGIHPWLLMPTEQRVLLEVLVAVAWGPVG